MTKVKCELEKKMNDLRKEVKKDRSKNKIAEKKKEENDKTCIEEKLCPFMTSPDKQVACTPQCQLYRVDKGKFECPFSELPSISWKFQAILKYFKIV